MTHIKSPGILKYKLNQILISKKKIIRYCVDFTVPANHKVKQKENGKIKKCLGLKKLRNIRVTVMPIVIGELGTVLKHMEKRQA